MEERGEAENGMVDLAAEEEARRQVERDSKAVVTEEGKVQLVVGKKEEAQENDNKKGKRMKTRIRGKEEK